MEAGYLTDQGNLVVIDSIGTRTLFTAYALQGGFLRFLTLTVPLQTLGDVRVHVTLHRKGWNMEAEDFVDSTEAQMFAAPGFHILLGPRWHSIRTRGRGDARTVHWPRGSGRKAVKRQRGVAPPSDHAPLVILLEHSSVRACRRRGRSVEVHALELREFSDLVLGKLTAHLQFSDEISVDAFAKNFSSLDDLAGLDRRVGVDVDRRKAFVWTRVSTAFALIAVVGFSGVLAALLWTYSIDRMDHVVRFAAALWTGAVLFAWEWGNVRWMSSYEFRDLIRKWPRVAIDRWAEQAKAVPESFVEGMEAMGLRLEGNLQGLRTLDGYLRQLPADTYFRAFAMDAAAFVGDTMMRLVRTPVEWRWRWNATHGDAVVDIPSIDHWVSPITLVAKIWVNKDPIFLDSWVMEQVSDINERLPPEERELEGDVEEELETDDEDE